MGRNFHVLLCILLCFSISWTAKGIELTAPAGGEMDLQKNTVKYYGVESKPVEARWDEMVLQAQYLEYYREQEIIKGKNEVMLIQNQPQKRTLKSVAVSVDLRKEYFVASQGVVLSLRDDTIISSELMEWAQKNDELKVTNGPVIHYQNWQIKGSTILGYPNKGLFTINGPVFAFNNEITIRAGQVIFNQIAERLTIKDEPVLRKGDNELTATEIIYDLKTEKVTAQGVVKTKIIRE